ncbi:hypothetical protein TL16_g10972 [Triparma laevis f. inornata]|uniref:Uncharacterized protein n=1 Tax=Triparma laevis f. inornata TaxID=1714386 RepID=A0A9W7BBB6_9STRA|nr:hypothetical protein TL16_g10972 [Triparma laevis f. inornata]
MGKGGMPDLTQKHWDFANQITNNTVVGTPTWIGKLEREGKAGKTVPRLLIVGKYHIYTAKTTTFSSTLKVAKQAHIYDLVQMGHVTGRDNAIELIFMRDEQMLFEFKFASIPSASIEQSIGLSVLFTIQCARMQISYKFPASMLCYIPDRSLDMLKDMPRPWERMMPAQAHVETYHATCTYEDHPVRDTVVTHIFTELQGLSWQTKEEGFEGRCMNLTDCFKGVSSPYFNDKDVNSICSVLAHSPWYKTVIAEGMSVSSRGAQVLFAAISNKQCVEKVIMRNMNLTSKKAAAIMAIGGSVKILDFSNNPLGDAGMTGLSSAFVPEEFDEDDYTCALEELYLSKCGIQAGDGFQTLCGNILSTTMASSLTLLDLSYNLLGQKGSESLALFLGMSQNLQNLNMMNTQADMKIVMASLSLNNRLHKTLKVLHVSHNPFDKEAAAELGGFLKKTEALSNLNLVKMATLDSVCYADILSSLFSNTTSLPNDVTLNFSRNKFTHADVAAVSTHIEGSPRFPISRLYLNHCSLGVEGMSIIAQALVERKPGTLKDFSASANMSPGFFTSAGTIHNAQTAISRLIKSSEPLVELDLSGDDSHRFGEYIVPIVEALKSNSSLRHVDFSNHKAGDKLTLALAEVLTKNDTLNEVWFDKNSTTVEGFKALAKKLEENKSICSLGPPLKDMARTEKANKGELSTARDTMNKICEKNVAEGGTTVMMGPLPDDPSFNLERQRSKGQSTGSRVSTVEPIEIIHDDHVDSEEEKEEEAKRMAELEAIEPAAIGNLTLDKDITSSAPTPDSEEAGDEKPKVKFSEENEVQTIPAHKNEEGEEDGYWVGRDTDDTSLEGLARSSMEIKLHLYELASAEAKDHKAEMETKLAEVEERQKRLLDEAKKEAEDAAKISVRADMENEMREKMQSEIETAKEAAIKEANEAATKLQEELAKNQEETKLLQDNADKEREKLEKTLGEKAEKELKEQMQILKKATGMAEAELQWAIESSTGNSFLMAEEKKSFHELEYSKLMFEMSKTEKLLYLLKNPNIGRALVSAGKAISEERLRKKSDNEGGGDATPKFNPLEKQMSSRAPPAFLAQLKDGGAKSSPKAARPNPFGGGNPFAAAVPAKNGGGGPPKGGTGFLSQLTRGGVGGGLKKSAITIKASREKLEKLLVGEQKQVDAIPYKLKDFEFVVDLIKAVLDADDDNFANTAKAKNEELKAKDKELKMALMKIQQENGKHEGEIEIWNERMNTAPEKAEEMDKRENVWVEKQNEKNLQCLKIMRSYIPVDIQKLSVKQVLEKAKKEGGQYTYTMAERFKNKKLLHWLVLHKDDISRENFLVGGNVSSFKNLSDYDVIELRAVYACLPEKFELDNTPGKVGQKLEWKNGLIAKLKAMSSQQEGETVASGWDPVKQEQKFEKLKPLQHEDERNLGYYYLDENGMKDKIAHFETIEQRLDGLLKRCKVLEGEEGKSIGLVAEMKAEVNAALEDFRSEYLQQEYGKDILKTLRDEAQTHYKKVVVELGELKTSDKGKVTGKGLKLKIYNLRESIKSASPNKQECLEEFAKVRAQKLHVGDGEADAAVLTGVLEIPYDQVLSGFCNVEFKGRGCLIGGVFNPQPELNKRERTAFKKLSDEEEARQRKIDMANAMAAREETGAASVKDGLQGGANNSSDKGGVVTGAGEKRGSIKPTDSMKKMLEGQHGGVVKKEKKPVVKRAPKSKALQARASAVLLGAGDKGGELKQIADLAAAGKLGEISEENDTPPKAVQCRREVHRQHLKEVLRDLRRWRMH